MNWREAAGHGQVVGVFGDAGVPLELASLLAPECRRLRPGSACAVVGARAEPVADKLTMSTGTVLLAMQQALPWWFASVLGRATS